MIQESRTLTAIDVGTSKVCSIAGRISSSRRLQVLAHSTVPSEGLRKGNVIDVEAAQKAISASLNEVQQRLGTDIKSAHVGVTGAHMAFENRWDLMDLTERGVVSAGALAQLPDRLTAATREPDRRVIHTIPMAFSLDGNGGIRNPLGMHAEQVEVETHVVTGASNVVGKLVRAVEGSGVEVSSLVLEPLASGQAVLTPEERNRGAVVVDIGGGTTDVVVFNKGRICFTGVIPVGGFQFTNDICVTYDTPYETAETAKLHHATTEPFGIRPDEEVRLRLSGRDAEIRVPRRDMCQLIRERAQELVSLIELKLNEADLGDLAGVPLVVTGGTSNLPGLETLLRQSLTNRVRLGVPNGRMGLPAELKNPAHATGVGILLWALSQPESATEPTSSPRRGASAGTIAIISRLVEQVRNLFTVRTFLPKKGGSDVRE